MTANLLSRLQGLTAPNREVDALIHTATNAPLRDGLRFGRVPAYTASLDATVALCERVLPGCDWDVEKWMGKGIACVNSRDNELAATPAIALLIAILTALEDRDARD